jgi:hypothetical protein
VARNGLRWAVRKGGQGRKDPVPTSRERLPPGKRGLRRKRCSIGLQPVRPSPAFPIFFPA